MHTRFIFYITLSILLLSNQSSIVAQDKMVTISGKVVDTASFQYLENTSVSVVRIEDTILQSFGRADAEGNFSLQVPANKSYTLIIAHPSFAIINNVIDVKNDNLNLGNVIMLTKKFLLQDVIVKGERAIVIKGDTTEYAADSFKVRDFDNVEELLKRLPGIEVDAKGNIKAHGEKVQKMLVDGDEFFGDDPAVLSKMLRASAVDKVQVFDKKSATAELSGIDDGERIKTINLKLKDGAKAGQFGKIEISGGLPGYWENQAMINSFKGKRKMSAFGVMSNTNKVGLGWDDSRKYTGSDGGISFDIENDEMSRNISFGDEFSSYDGKYRGQGLPKTWNGGLYYGDKFGKNEQHKLTSDYRFNKNDLISIVNTRNQYILADTQYVNNSNETNTSTAMNNTLSGRTEIKIDTLSDLIVSASANIKNSKSLNVNDNSYSAPNGIIINQSESHNSSEGIQKNFTADATFRKKFLKLGRSLSLNAKVYLTDNSSNGSFNSTNKFFQIGTETNFDQRKKYNHNNKNFKSNITYTEPLKAEEVFLTTSYNLGYDELDNEILSFDRFNNTDTLNNLFSSHYNVKNLSNAIGSFVRFNYSKIKFNLGGSVAYTNFNQYDYFTDSTHRREYINFFPKAEIRLGNDNTTRLNIRYNGRTRQPSMNQLQPIRNNNNPTNIMIGNPNLTQEFIHNVSVDFSKSQILKQRYFYGNVGINYTQNAISLNQNITPAGIRTYTYENLDGNFNAYSWVGMSTKFLKRSHLSFGFNGNVSKNNTILNNVKTIATNYSLGPNVSISYFKDTTIQVYYSLSFNHNNNYNSSRNDIRTKFNQYNQSLNASYNFPKGFSIGTEIDWNYRQKIDANDLNNNVFLLNAFVAKTFLKDKSLMVKFTGNDILNQNIGFDRFVSDNNVTEMKYNNIRRYFMLTLSWNFTRSNAMDSNTQEIKSDNVEAASSNPDDYKE